MKFTITPEQLADIAMNADVDEEESIRPDYSGRGMYGKTCLGLTTGSYSDGPNEAWFQLELANSIVEADAKQQGYEIDEYDRDDYLDALRNVISELNPSRDSMGIGGITYWTNVSVEER